MAMSNEVRRDVGTRSPAGRDAQLTYFFSFSNRACSSPKVHAMPNQRDTQAATTLAVVFGWKQLLPQVGLLRFTQRLICAPNSFMTWFPYISDQLLALYLISRVVRT